MYVSLHKTLISFDLIEKFNQKKIESFLALPSLTLNFNEKKIDSNLLFSVPIFYINLYLLNLKPHFVRLRHAVSNFKTRGGEQHGAKSDSKKTAAYNFLVEALYAFFFEMTGIDSAINPGVSNKNNFSVGYTDVKKVGKLSQLEIEYANALFGMTLSFAIKKTKSETQDKHFGVIMSTFFVAKILMKVNTKLFREFDICRSFFQPSFGYFLRDGKSTLAKRLVNKSFKSVFFQNLKKTQLHARFKVLKKKIRVSWWSFLKTRVLVKFSPKFIRRRYREVPTVR